MSKLVCNQNKVNDMTAEELIGICPFNALEYNDGRIEVNSGCKMCMLCVRKGPAGVMELVEEHARQIDKGLWSGIAVYVEHSEGRIHPVTFELIGKAKELAAAVGFPVYCVFMGYSIEAKAEELLYYGVDEVFVYDHEALRDFRIEPYTAVLEDFIRRLKPSTVLVGATATGRSLAPRAAARLKTGLTADCTSLELNPNTDLVQIRPAFGGNIMARILCPGTRPQMATVRYKVMNAPERRNVPSGRIIRCEMEAERLASGIEVLKVTRKASEEELSDAEIIVAVGRAFRKEADMDMARELAGLLGARIAGTRPLVEMGFINPKQQIGLSGRTVKPKLIITLGISGAIQFIAGMNGSERIFAINCDSGAPIFNVAHYGIVGDVYEIVPRLVEKIRVSGAEALTSQIG
ncbi:MAG TPA: electron transfer flavoprotein subunit alpha [Negativicutes bacterium]|nr:electron transfer flavoprotein subunit alpha [Negativicutes bacterium]